MRWPRNREFGFWDEWRGSTDGRPSMYIRRVLSWRGYRIDIHKFVRPDDPLCFHTHPAAAIRVVLWGGYVEQIEQTWLGGYFLWRKVRPGHVGVVRPNLCHRIDKLLNGRVSYSLWLRGPVTHKVKVRGC